MLKTTATLSLMYPFKRKGRKLFSERMRSIPAPSVNAGAINDGSSANSRAGGSA